MLWDPAQTPQHPALKIQVVHIYLHSAVNMTQIVNMVYTPGVVLEPLRRFLRGEHPPTVIERLDYEEPSPVEELPAPPESPAERETVDVAGYLVDITGWDDPQPQDFPRPGK